MFITFGSFTKLRIISSTSGGATDLVFFPIAYGFAPQTNSRRVSGKFNFPDHLGGQNRTGAEAANIFSELSHSKPKYLKWKRNYIS